MKIKYVEFEVPGAGVIRMSKDAHCMCGPAVGFLFGVSWGHHGFTGGTLGRDEAKRMAEFMLSEIAKCDETMDDERERRYKEMLSQ